jgi:hypothetical protein
MTQTLQQIVDTAIEDLEERIKDENETGYVGDVISEIADGSVPIYNADLLELAAQNNDLALSEPEIGPAFDGTATPINIIAANVYETIQQAPYEHSGNLECSAMVCDECDALHDVSDLDYESEDDDAEQTLCPDCGRVCREPAMTQ